MLSKNIIIILVLLLTQLIMQPYIARGSCGDAYSPQVEMSVGIRLTHNGYD